MLKTSIMIATALAGLTVMIPVASAQSGTYWSFDGKTSYTSYQACEDARKTRGIGRTAVGGAVGAGLGTLAGGDDTRNAVIGGIVGAIAGGATGSTNAQCQAYSYSSSAAGYSGSKVYSQTTYHSGYSGGQTRYYTTTQPGYTSYGQGSGYTYTTTQPYQTQHGYNHSYTTQPYYGQTSTTYTRTYTAQPQYQYHPHGTVTYSQQPTYYHTNSQTGGYGSTTFWSYDGQSRYQSYEACEQAKRQRTLASGGLGALAGAGLGTLAGGDDGRNAVVGAVAGGVLGAYSGNRSIQCSQYTVANYR